MIEPIVQALSWLFILAGSGFVVIGAFGTWRFPDFWSRLHAASITDSAGMILLIIGMMLQAGLTLITVKLLILGVFMFITGPTSTHAVANAAWVTGLRPPRRAGSRDADTEPGTNAGHDSAQRGGSDG